MLYLDGDSQLKQPLNSREHFIPLHATDVIEFLAQHPELPADQQDDFRELAALILSLLHHLYRQRHEHLTYIYAPLDPDRDRLLRTVPTAAYRNELATELFDCSRDALLRANYHKLSPVDIQNAIAAASQWGVRMRANFAMLQRLEVYARGYVIGQREYCNWQNWFRKETVDVKLYQRIVVLFRVKPERASSQFDPRRVYMRMFKNVPQQDIDMMLPATGIHMSWLDHSKIVVPSLYAAGMTLWRFLRNVMLLAFFGVFKTIGLIVLILFAVGFGMKSMLTYRTNTQRRYMLNMTQSLYYQNLDNNAGVLLRLLEEGEQQEACEAILAYFVTAFLMPQCPHSLEEIDLACEEVLQGATGIHVDFDVEDTARNLIHLGILNVGPDGWTAPSLKEALRTLDSRWDNWFGSASEDSGTAQQ